MYVVNKRWKMGLYREEVKAKTLTADKKARDEDGKKRK